MVKAAAKRVKPATVRRTVKTLAERARNVFDPKLPFKTAEQLAAAAADTSPTLVFGTEGFDKTGHLVDPKLASAPIGTGLTEEETEAAIARVRDLEPLSPIRDDRMQERLAAAAGWLGGDPERVKHFNEWRVRKMTGLAEDIQAGRVRLVDTQPARRRWRLLDPALTLVIGALVAVIAVGAGIIVGQVLARLGVVIP